MKVKLISAILLTTALTASIATPTAFAANEETSVAAVEQQSTQSSITSITATQDIYKTGVYVDFDIVTVKNTTKLQVKYASTTSTYNRTHEKVTIVDNNDGTETWTIPVKTNDTLTVEVRAKFGKTWETEYATATYEIKQEPVIEQKIISVSTPQKTIFADSINVPFDITVTANATKMQVVYGASTVTYTRTHSKVTIVDNADGTETWTVPVNANAQGTATFKVKYKAWSENFVYEYEVKTAEERFIDAVVDWNTQSGNGLSWVAQTVKITTSSDSNKLRLVFTDWFQKVVTTTFYADSANIKVTDNGDGTKTWSFDKVFADGGLYEIYVAGSSNKLVYGGELYISIDDECDFNDVYIERNKLRVHVENHADSVILCYENGETTQLNRASDFVMDGSESVWICDVPEDGEYTLVAKARTEQSKMTYTFAIENGQIVRHFW